MSKPIIVSNVSDASFAIGVAYSKKQEADISDLIYHQTFANTEFCPRFMLDEVTEENIGNGLKGKSVYIISTSSPRHTRNTLAMRNLLIASAAKENGADFVALIEPDLFYSSQDRGPRTLNHPQISDFYSRKKFAGQTCSAQLYAKLLKESGVDLVMTVHNHKPKVLSRLYKEIFFERSSENKPCFINLDIAHIVSNFILRYGLARTEDYGANIGFVAPDSGAVAFASRVRNFTGLDRSVLVNIDKVRHGQRDVELSSNEVEILRGKDVFILDDMVRTGGTIAASIKLLAENEKSRPNSIFFYCTHAYISAEGRQNLNSPYLTQFVTTNTMPNILNRDDQGRLRKKTIVLKIEKWISNAIIHCLEQGRDPEEVYGRGSVRLAGNLYDVDVSSKNPRRKESRLIQYEMTV